MIARKRGKVRIHLEVKIEVWMGGRARSERRSRRGEPPGLGAAMYVLLANVEGRKTWRRAMRDDMMVVLL